MENFKIAILCASEKSNYFQLSNCFNLDIYTASRSMRLFNDNCPVICHPPCAQWSRLSHFSKVNVSDKNLAIECWEIMQRNGGIFEHPSGTSFFKYVNADKKNMISVDQHWWNFPARKRTLLYFHKYHPLAYPLNFNCYPGKVHINLTGESRSLGTLSFNHWLIDCIIQGQPSARGRPAFIQKSKNDSSAIL